VSHSRRWAPDYRGRVFGEYAQSLADLGLVIDVQATVLDFGCADGIFLDFLAKQGVPHESMSGVDVSEEMIEVVRSKGYRGVTTDALEELSDSRFGLITLWDVVEHLPRPVETLTTLRRLARDDASVVVQTPRIGLLAEVLGDRFEHYLPIEHVHLFSRESLVGAIEKAGFRVHRVASFGANAPPGRVPDPYKGAYDRLAKLTDNGATQLLLATPA